MIEVISLLSMIVGFDGAGTKVETETGSSFAVVSEVGFVFVVGIGTVVVGIVVGTGIVVVKVDLSTVAAVLVRSVGVVRN